MTLIYLKILPSTQEIPGSRLLVRLAVVSVVSYLMYGTTLFLFPWARVLTYLAGALVIAYILEILITGVNPFPTSPPPGAGWYPHFHRLFGLLVRILIFGVLGFFVGF
jgi:hypothetical protein